MSIFDVTRSDFETFTIVTNPIRTYVSSSVSGATGSVHVFARRSNIEKELAPLPAFVDATHDDSDINSLLRTLQYTGRVIRNSVSSSLSSSALFNNMMSEYLTKVNEQSISARKQKALDVIRFTPSYNFTANTSRKLIVKDILNSYYRTSYPTAHWAYSNYDCLSFYTCSLFPTSSALLYPNTNGGESHEGYVTGAYALSGAFSFDFYINPRYQSDDGSEFKAGTILHLSSTYAVSLVTGSAKDENGRPIGFKLLLQLSQSADAAPSIATNGASPNDLVFTSDDNSLTYNKWHHVVIRWGTRFINDGTGSFNIDGVDKGTFVVPSGTIASQHTSQPHGALVVGNFYEGWDDMAKFFAHDPAARDGLQELLSTTGVEEPSSYSFDHPLNADLHDIAIKRYYMSDLDISTSASVGPKSITDDSGIAFYVPPFFVEEAPFRKYVTNHGGILQTPFFEVDGTTNDPFNVAMSFGVAGHYINIENFLRDFASNVFPRVHHLTGTAITYTSAVKSANEFLYDDPFVAKRNALLMPCDDGLFVPSYELLASESNGDSYYDDLGVEELSFINLSNLVSSSSLLFGTSFDSSTKTQDEANKFVNEQVGFTPEQPGLSPGPAFNQYASNVSTAVTSGTFDAGVQDGAPLTIYQRTRDSSSNQVVFFDISNMFYGKRILPGSLQISDSSMSGSHNKITLRDDSRGNLYRADCVTSASTWNSVGNVYYDEGIIAIKSPHLFFFGKEQYELSFRGEQNIHVLRLDSLAQSNHLNSSSNPNFVPVSASLYENDYDKDFVYISCINYHDENLNVVAKTQLAQPILKRHGERMMFRSKIDF